MMQPLHSNLKDCLSFRTNTKTSNTFRFVHELQWAFASSLPLFAWRKFVALLVAKMTAAAAKKA